MQLQPHKQPKKLVMSQIKNITNLEELVKYDELFRGYTKAILTDFNLPIYLSDDFVNDFYLKLHKAFEKGKVIDGGYCVIVLKNLIINYKNSESKKNYQTDEIIDMVEENNEDVIKEKLEDEEKYKIIEDRIERLSWYEKSILKLNQEMSLLELSKRSTISYRSLVYNRQKINEKLGIQKKK